MEVPASGSPASPPSLPPPPMSLKAPTPPLSLLWMAPVCTPSSRLPLHPCVSQPPRLKGDMLLLPPPPARGFGAPQETVPSNGSQRVC